MEIASHGSLSHMEIELIHFNETRLDPRLTLNTLHEYRITAVAKQSVVYLCQHAVLITGSARNERSQVSLTLL